MDNDEINALVDDWSDVYKKGQLTFWVLLSISRSKRYAAEITEYMYELTDGTFEVKEQSLYRALRRFSGMGLVKITKEPSPNSGPDRKYYELTSVGKEVLLKFIENNISPLYNKTTKELIEALK